MKAINLLKHLGILAFSISTLVQQAMAKDNRQVESNRLIEVSLVATQEITDPFNSIELDVVVSRPDGSHIRIPGFWAGKDRWCFRYSSAIIGTHQFKTSTTPENLAGLDNQTGTIEVTPYSGDNPLYRHGPLIIADDHRHFAHADGTPFFWLGDTWWMGLTKRLDWPNGFQDLAADRVKKGFNVVQIVAGLYPDMAAFDERGRNEFGFPWAEDYSTINPEYFDLADRRLQYLADQGIAPCIVGAWGYHLPWMGTDAMRKHWRYLVARYGALPVVWCIAGEVNLPYYLDKGFPLGGERQAKNWEELARYVREIDGFQRLITIHPTGLPPLSGRLLYDDQNLFDFDMLQTGHGMLEVLPPSIAALEASLKAQPPKPVINSEVAYEALLDGRITAEAQRAIFWASLLSGAAGQTYGANGIWQVNQTEQPYGASPHGGNYGTLPWRDAMRLPGSGQIALGKQTLEDLDWTSITPHPEWVIWSTNPNRNATWPHWIWYPENEPAQHAPVGDVYFRKTFFTLEEPNNVKSGWLRATADDRCEVFLNGQSIGSTANWRSVSEWEIAADVLKPGQNTIAVHARNESAPVEANPAGLLLQLDLEFTDGRSIAIGSDSSWKSSRDVNDDWKSLEFDDAQWASSAIAAQHGEAPWGKVKATENAIVPYAAGLGDGTRLYYAPLRKGIAVTSLDPQHEYVAEIIDPTTGESTSIEPIQSTGETIVLVQPSQKIASDWLLKLSPTSK